MVIGLKDVPRIVVHGISMDINNLWYMKTALICTLRGNKDENTVQLTAKHQKIVNEVATSVFKGVTLVEKTMNCDTSV